MPENENNNIFAPLRDRSNLMIADNIIKENPILGTVKQLLDVMKDVDIRKLFSDLLDKLTDKDFYNKLFNALKEYIEDHPWQVAMFVIGVILMTNPIGLLGFGTLGPVAGSIAAAWQASIGGAVAAGSAFAVLQSIGMTYGVVIPVAGAVMAGGAAGAAIADGASKATKEVEHGVEEAGEASEEVSKTAENGADDANKEFDEVERGAQDAAENARNAFDDMGKGAQDAAENAGNAFDDMGKGIQNMVGSG